MINNYIYIKNKCQIIYKNNKIKEFLKLIKKIIKEIYKLMIKLLKILSKEQKDIY